MRRFLVLLCALALIMTAVACGSGDSGSSSDTGASGAGKAPDLASYQPGKEEKTGVEPTTFGDVTPAGDYTYGVSLPWIGDPFWVGVAYGIEERAKELGIKINFNAANGYGDTANQLRHFDTYTTQGVDGIIVGAVDNEAIAPAVDAAWDAGIPVSFVAVSAASDRSMGVYTDDVLAGQAQADYIAAKDPNAKVVMFCGPPGVIWPKLRCDAFKARLKEKAPNAQILAEKYHQMDRAVVADQAGNTLQAFPQTTWVFNNTDLQAKGVIDALKAEGKKAGDVKVTNLTMTSELVDLWKQGWVQFAVAERPVMQGRLAVDQLTKVLNGEQVPATWRVAMPGFEYPTDVEKFDAGEAKWNYAPADYRAG